MPQDIYVIEIERKVGDLEIKGRIEVGDGHAYDQPTVDLIATSDDAIGALKKPGLNFGQLKQMAPEQQFLTVADAIGRIANPTEKAWAARQIFGKGGARRPGPDGHLQLSSAMSLTNALAGVIAGLCVIGAVVVLLFGLDYVNGVDQTLVPFVVLWSFVLTTAVIVGVSVAKARRK